MSTDIGTPVEAVMTTKVETISADATIREAAEAMSRHGNNSLLVPGTETGIITSTDILEAIAAGANPDSRQVDDVMTKPVEWIRADLGLQEAAAMMENHGINHLPVRDRSGDYVGLVSTTDVRNLFIDSVT